MCILWLCLSAGKHLGASSFSKFSEEALGFAPSVLGLMTQASPSAPQQKNPRYGPVIYDLLNLYWNDQD
jgi:hypothetical protein